ncbi:MAG: hypothetical protein WBD28_10785 [Candidatus Zixiibacteriota bacterium]
MRRHEKLLLVILCLLILLLTGCTSGPSKKEIEGAVRESLQQKVPSLLSGYYTGGEDVIIEGLWVVKIGKAQGQGSDKYWPVKVYAKGSCKVLFGGRRPFAGETEYNVRKDPYGKWVAEPAGF